MRKLISIIQKIRLLAIAPWVNWKDNKFMMDLLRWKKICHIEGSNYAVLAQLLWSYQEFRNLFIYRNNRKRIYRCWIGLVYPPMSTLYLETGEIGGGLFIQHGFATMVAARSIGENCWINQQVTIGYRNGENPPVLEDNVSVTCGAKVLGDITMHTGSLAAAGAVVVKDVPENAIVAGVPAKIIGYKDENNLDFQG